MKLIATQSFSYNTRRLQAGDIFEAKTPRDGNLLVAIKKARSLETRPEEEVAAPSKSLLNKVESANNGTVKTQPVILVDETKNDEKIKELENAKIADAALADKKSKADELEKFAIAAAELAEKNKKEALEKEALEKEALEKEALEKEEDKSSNTTQTRTRGRAKGN